MFIYTLLLSSVAQDGEPKGEPEGEPEDRCKVVVDTLNKYSCPKNWITLLAQNKDYYKDCCKNITEVDECKKKCQNALNAEPKDNEELAQCTAEKEALEHYEPPSDEVACDEDGLLERLEWANSNFGSEDCKGLCSQLNNCKDTCKRHYTHGGSSELADPPTTKPAETTETAKTALQDPVSTKPAKSTETADTAQEGSSEKAPIENREQGQDQATKDSF